MLTALSGPTRTEFSAPHPGLEIEYEYVRIKARFRWLDQKVPIKFPKIIRRASECGPFLIKSQLSRQFRFLVGINVDALTEASIVAFICVDEPAMLNTHFIEYQFNIGIDFIFLIIGANHQTALPDDWTAVAGNRRISIVARVNDGDSSLDFCVSQLAQQYCNRKWALFCNQYEYPFYPYCDSRSLKDLLLYQDSLKERSLGALVIDCFGNEEMEVKVTAPEAFFEINSYFISSGYSIERDSVNDTFSCRASHREIIEQYNLESNVACTAAAKWKHHYNTVGKLRRLRPRQRNHVFQSTKLHIAFLSIELWAKSKQFANLPVDQLELIKRRSIRLSHWSCLAEAGLLNLGEWSL